MRCPNACVNTTLVELPSSRYFHNRATGESTWSNPALAKAAAPRTKAGMSSALMDGHVRPAVHAEVVQSCRAKGAFSPMNSCRPDTRALPRAPSQIPLDRQLACVVDPVGWVWTWSSDWWIHPGTHCGPAAKAIQCDPASNLKSAAQEPEAGLIPGAKDPVQEARMGRILGLQLVKDRHAHSVRLAKVVTSLAAYRASSLNLQEPKIAASLLSPTCLSSLLSL